MKGSQPHSKWLIPGLCLVILFQVLVLAMVYVNAQIPLWTGQQIRLKTTPVDPRSLFRGNYAFLNYEISRIPAADINRIHNPKPNQKIYVRLQPNMDGTYRYKGVGFAPPESGIYIRGRIQSPSHTTTGTYRVKYGIEAYFAPKKKALALEKQLRSNAAAEIWITDRGKAALGKVIPNEG